MNRHTKIIQQHDEAILQKKNVIGVGVGRKNGDGEKSIVVLVEKKEELSALSADELVPSEIDGVKTDVFEIGELKPLSKTKIRDHKKKHRPVHGGISAIWREGSACTLGAVVWKDGKLMGLMNTHCGNPHWDGAEVGDKIIQPSGNDFGKRNSNRDVIGVSTPLYQHLILDGKTDNKFDSCLIELDVEAKDLYQEGFGEIKALPKEVRVGDRVIKSGRTTGLTESVVIVTDATVRVNYGEGIGVFRGQVIAENNNKHFLDGGDSSSLVVNENGHPVGQAFAGSSKTAIFTPIKPIIDHFGFSFSEIPPIELPHVFTKFLRRGSEGFEVEKLQERLNEILGLGLYIDGDFGPATERAVKMFQSQNNLTADGLVGPATRAALNGFSPEPKVELYPKVAQLRNLFVKVMKAAGHDVVITQEYRSFEEQNRLYNQGRTTPGAVVTNAKGGQSFHNWRVAFDFAFVEDGQPSWAEKHPWSIAGAIGKALGLTWGGDFKTILDRPHFEFTQGYSISDFQKGNIDESKFDICGDDTAAKYLSENNYTKNMSLLHRIKSAAITAISFIGTAIVSVAIANPEAVSGVATLFESWLGRLGLPEAITIFVALIVNEIIRQLLNYRKLKAAKLSASSLSVKRNRRQIELY